MVHFGNPSFRLNRQRCAFLLGVYMRALITWLPRFLPHRDYCAPADAQRSDGSDDASIECILIGSIQYLGVSIKTCVLRFLNPPTHLLLLCSHCRGCHERKSYKVSESRATRSCAP